MSPATLNEVTNNAIGIVLCVVLSAVFTCVYINMVTRNLRKLIKEYNERYGQLARQAKSIPEKPAGNEIEAFNISEEDIPVEKVLEIGRELQNEKTGGMVRNTKQSSYFAIPLSDCKANPNRLKGEHLSNENKVW